MAPHAVVALFEHSFALQPSAIRRRRPSYACGRRSPGLLSPSSWPRAAAHTTAAAMAASSQHCRCCFWRAASASGIGHSPSGQLPAGRSPAAAVLLPFPAGRPCVRPRCGVNAAAASARRATKHCCGVRERPSSERLLPTADGCVSMSERNILSRFSSSIAEPTFGRLWGIGGASSRK